MARPCFLLWTLLCLTGALAYTPIAPGPIVSSRIAGSRPGGILLPFSKMMAEDKEAEAEATTGEAPVLEAAADPASLDTPLVKNVAAFVGIVGILIIARGGL